MIPSFNPIIWFGVIAVVAGGGGYLGVIHPLNHDRDALRLDAEQKQATLALLQQSMASANDSGNKADALRAALADFQSRLPADGQMDKVLEDIWRMAQANSLQTKTVKAPANQHASGFDEQTMELTLTGDFSGFYQFLLQLEDARHVMRIKKLHLIKSAGHDSEMQADMTLSFYSDPVSVSF